MDVSGTDLFLKDVSAPPTQSSDLAFNLSALINQCEVVSFDVFDTLLVRRLVKPDHVFEIVARQERIRDFHQLRITAEARARIRKQDAEDHPEVTLKEIYDELTGSLREKAPRLMTIELAVERLVLRPNPAIRCIYDAAVTAGKTIVATTDVYLPANFIEDLLRTADLPVAAVYASGELRKSKHKGDLFGYVAADNNLHPERILHIGDNLESDFKSALEAGCAAWHSASNLDRLCNDTRYNQAALCKLLGMQTNLFASSVAAYIANRAAVVPECGGQTIFGRMYAGPMLAGFARWVDHLRKTAGVKRLYLLARDGYLIEQALQAAGSDAERMVIYSSRRMCYLATLELDFDDICLTIAKSAVGVSAYDVVKGLQVAYETDLIEALEAHIDVDAEVLNTEDVERFAKALRQCRDVLTRIAREERATLIDYLKPLRLTEPDAAIVDCGWALTSHKCLELLTGGKIRGYYVGTVDHAYQHDLIHSFLFEKGHKSPWKSIHEDAAEILELPFSSTARQAVRMMRNDYGISPVFSDINEPAENVRAVVASMIRQESLAFCYQSHSISRHIRLAETEEALLVLFKSLIRTPTAVEYHALSVIPHIRTAGSHGMQTIASYWRCCFTQTSRSTGPGILFYVRLSIVSLCESGWLTTVARIRRKIRLWVRR